MDIKGQVKAYILEDIMMGADPSELSDSASFLDSGILDSTGVVELISFLEKTFGIKVRDEEMIPENLDTLFNVERFVGGKLKVQV